MGAPHEPDALQARDVVVFGQEFGRVLSDGRIVGRAEPFAKVFPSSRAVKRAVGPIAWAILEDIALDAKLDDQGRLVAETNVRRLSENLGLATNTVAKHLGRLREHGFVLHEEHREATSGKYAESQYVLDPSACLERFTHTPVSTPIRRAVDNDDSPVSTPIRRPVDNRAAESADRPESSTEAVSRPCRNSCDTDAATVSQSTRHRDLRHNKEEVVVGEEEQQQGPDEPNVAATEAERDASNEVEVGEPPDERRLVDRLTALGVHSDHALALMAEHPAGQIVDVLDAVEVADVRSPAGWVVTAIREGWDVSEAAEQLRRERAGQRLRAREGALRRRARQRQDRRLERLAGWEAAVSAALADDQLTAALEAVTEPVAGVVGRRSVAVAVAQLVGWAAAAHLADFAQPLDQVLPQAAAGPAGGGPAAAGAVSGPRASPESELPEPPTPAEPAEPLRARVARLLPALDHRPTTTAAKELT